MKHSVDNHNKMAAEKSASFIVRLVDMVSSTAKKIGGSVSGVVDKFKKLGAAAASAGKTAFFITALATSVNNASAAIDQTVAPGVRFETSMADLAAITGVTQEKLDLLSDSARKSGKVFGSDAAAQVESYKNILSKLGPEIADSPKALESMGNSVQMLAKTMKGDAVGAADALTTAMNQYGVALEDPEAASRSMYKMMDVMTAAAVAGAAEVPDIAESIKVAGLSAKNANLSFEEFNAAIEVLGKGSIKGAEAGTALRNVLALMSREEWIPPHTRKALEAAGVDIHKLADTTIPFADRLREVSKVQGDSALVAKLFGLENKNAALQLMENIPLLEKYTSEVGKNGTTVGMVNTIMDTHQEKMNRVKAVFADWGIAAFNATKNMLPFIQTFLMIMAYGGQILPILFGAGKFIKTMGFNALKTARQFIFSAVVGVGSFIGSLTTATLAMFGLNVAMYANPVGLFVLGLLAIIAVVTLIITYWDDLKKYFIDLALWFSGLTLFAWLLDLVDVIFPGIKDKIFKFFGDIWDWLVGWAKKAFAWVGDLANALGASFDLNGMMDATITFDNKTDGKGDKKGNKKGPYDNLENNTSEVSVDSDRSRIVNVRIDKIEVNNNIDGSKGESLLDIIENKVAQTIVGAVRDAEIILSNG